MRRTPAVAGQFYHNNPEKLKAQVEQYILKNQIKEKVLGIVSPHAGLIYSGPVAGAVYSSIKFPEIFILLGPNHTGMGSTVSIMRQGSWLTPAQEFLIDEELSKTIIKHIPFAVDDPKAHKFEHSLEVQLPFIAYFSDSAKIVPISIMKATLSECQEIGKGLAKAILEAKKDIVMVASTDMSHYVSDKIARKLDRLAIDKILELNPKGLYEVVKSESISMCGYIPTTIMIFAALELGAKEAKLIKYATSADINNDYDYVVGYAGLIIK
ncbi:MAG: AmmeMemoRadiSam system protein B [Thermodesulfovibrionales bacterium]|nr:AmmeMemoRadiSam system protein B [Thermodesulfovibrionales bacterium]